MISSKHATKIARFLICSGKSAIPNPNALGGDMVFIDSIHLGREASGSGEPSRLLRPRTRSRPPTVALMTRPTAETMLCAPPKKVSPKIPITAQVVKYPSARAPALGRGLLGTQKQDGEEEQRRRDRATDSQDDESEESVPHGFWTLPSLGHAGPERSVARPTTPKNAPTRVSDRGAITATSLARRWRRSRNATASPASAPMTPRRRRFCFRSCLPDGRLPKHGQGD